MNPAVMQVHNMASVIVTATLPPFAQPGTRIDATSAAIGDASNLQGGILLHPLKAANGETYAVAQGPVITGGFRAYRGGNSETKNHPTVGRTPDGAIVERTPPSIEPSSHLKLQLRQSDFTTATRVVEAINKRFASPGMPVARAESSGLLVVDVPASYSTRTVEFISEMELLNVDADQSLKIVINERTGTIVMGKDGRSPGRDHARRSQRRNPHPRSKFNRCLYRADKRWQFRKPPSARWIRRRRPSCCKKVRPSRIWSAPCKPSAPRRATCSRFYKPCAPPAHSPLKSRSSR